MQNIKLSFYKYEQQNIIVSQIDSQQGSFQNKYTKKNLRDIKV